MPTLSDIRTKVRRLTGRPSPQQITDGEIDTYINTFYQYDLPETLRLFTLRRTFSFMTVPNVARYDMATMPVDFDGSTVSALNVYYNVQPPLYIAGYQSFWSQDREQFFRIYPELAQIQMNQFGDGTPGPYSIALTAVPVLQNQVTIGAVDANGDTIQVVDVPVSATSGAWKIINTSTAVSGSIDYVTGTGSITFANNVPVTNQITVTSVPYQANRPVASLFYANVFTLRPVPDAVYKVEVNAFVTPTALLQSGDLPELNLWWQYLAFGAAKKIFEDAQDPESVSLLMAAFNEQQSIVIRRALVQQSVQRTSTIYTEMTGFPYGNFNGRF